MKTSSLLVLCFWYALLTVASMPALALTVTWPQDRIENGKEVTLVANAVGDVLVESELKAASWTEKKPEAKPFAVGVAKAGLFAVRLQDTAGSHTALIALVPDGNKSLTLKAVDITSKARPADSIDAVRKLVEKFWAGLTRDRLAAAARVAWKPWAVANASNLTTTGVVCAIPGQQVSCGISVVGHGISLALAILAEVLNLMEKDKTLTGDEAKKLRPLLGITDTAADLALASSPLEWLVAAAAAVVEASVEDDTARVTIKVLLDAARKVVVIVEAVKK